VVVLVEGQAEGNGMPATITTGGTTLGSGNLYLNNPAGTLISDSATAAHGAAVFAAGGPATVVNAGEILESQTYSSGVDLSAGGTIENSGTIGAYGGGAYGISIRGSGIINNSGHIAGFNGNAYSFHGGGIYQLGDGTVTNGGQIVGNRPVHLVGDGSFINEAGGTVSGNFNGVYITYSVPSVGGHGTVTNLGTIEAGHGMAVFIFADGVVTNGAVNATSAVITGSVGAYVDTGAGTVTNYATIEGGLGVQLHGGGDVANGLGGDTAAVISATSTGIFIQNGAGTVANYSGVTGSSGVVLNGELVTQSYVTVGTVTSTITSTTISAGKVTNAGVIDGTAGVGVALITGGSVHNSGDISGTGNRTIVSYYTGSPGTYTATGTYTTGTAGAGVVIDGGGTVVNSGTLVGKGVTYRYFDNTDNSHSSLTSMGVSGVGVDLNGGGSVTNTAGGLIKGNEFGIAVTGGVGTVVNAGTIFGNTGTAVALDGTAGGLVVVDPGAVFAAAFHAYGTVSGGNAAQATLELASATNAGTLVGLGRNFVNFGSVDVDAGAVWTLTGQSTLTSGSTLDNAGTLGFINTLNVAGALIGTNGAAVSFADKGTLNSMLVIGQSAVVQGVIGGFVQGDTIDLAGVHATRATLEAGNVLDVLTTANGTRTLNLATNEDYSTDAFAVHVDGNGGTWITVEPASADNLTAGNGTIAVGHNTIDDLTALITGTLVTPTGETVISATAQYGSITVTNGDVQYTAPSSGSDTVTYTVSDGIKSPTGTITVAIDPGPTVMPGATIIGHVQSLDVTSFISSNSLVRAGLPNDGSALTSVFGPGGSVLPQSGGDFIFNPGTASGTVDLTYSATDKFGDVNVGTIVVTVEPGPNVLPGSTTIGHVQSFDATSFINSGSLIRHGLTGDGSALAKVFGPDGSVLPQSGGDFIFNPGTMTGTVALTYIAKDNFGDSATGTIELTVDQGPIVNSGTTIVGHNTATPTDLTSFVDSLFHANNLPGDTATLTAVSASAGTASLSGGKVTYLANTTTNAATLTYTVGDQFGDTATATVALTIDPGPTINNTGSAVVGHGKQNDIGVLLQRQITPGNEADPLLIVSASSTNGGTVESVGTLDPRGMQSVLYLSPDSPPGGTDTITYTASDGRGDTTTGTYTIVVDPGPIASNSSITLGHGQAIDLTSIPIVAPGLGGDSETLTFAGTSAPVEIVTFNNAGSIVSTVISNHYTFTALGTGTAAIGFTWNDEYKDTSSGTINVTIDPGPIVQPGTTTIGHSGSFDVTSFINSHSLIADGSLNDGSALTSVFGPGGSALPQIGGDFIFTPQGTTSPAHLTYTATDRFGDINTGTISVTVDKGPGVAPATTTIGHVQTLDATSLINSHSLISQGLAGDGSALSSVIGPNGTALPQTGGDFIFTPGTMTGTVALTYIAKDNLGDSATGTIDVNVDPGPTVPATETTTILHNQTVNLTSLILGSVTPGITGDTETVTNVVPTTGSISLSGGVVTYTAPSSGVDSLVYTVTDQFGDSATGTLDVNVTSDPGPTVSPTSVTVIGGHSVDLTSYLLTLATPGLPGDTLSLTGDNTTGTHGTVTLTKGDLSYLAPSSAGADSFNYTVSDQLGGTASAQVSVTVAANGFLGNVSGTVLLGNYSGLVIFGGNNVTMIGTDASDQILGGSGNNTITLGNGSDIVILGSGANTITLGNGSNLVLAGDGGDNVTAGSGSNAVLLGDGANTVTLGSGSDEVTLGNGNNTVTLGNGRDAVILGNGKNSVTAGNGSDWVTAGNGSNKITLGTGSYEVSIGCGEDDDGPSSSQTNTLTIAGSASSKSSINVRGGTNTLNLGAGTYSVNEDHGADTIILGSGKYTISPDEETPNTFIYTTPAGRLTTSFSTSLDKLVFSASGFNLGSTPSFAELFSTKTNGTFATAADRFTYNSSNGDLYYDASGNAAGSTKVLIGVLSEHLKITAANLAFTT
jgi:hypothetical protein